MIGSLTENGLDNNQLTASLHQQKYWKKQNKQTDIQDDENTNGIDG